MPGAACRSGTNSSRGLRGVICQEQHAGVAPTAVEGCGGERLRGRVEVIEVRVLEWHQQQ